MSNKTTSSSGGGDLKQKKPPRRVPKRGPGVAELEKILKERQNRDEPGEVGIGISSSDSLLGNFPILKDCKDFSFLLPPAVSGNFGTNTGNFNANVGFSGGRNLSSLLGDANLGGSGRNLQEICFDVPPLPRGTTLFRDGGGGSNSNCNCNSQSGGIDMGRSAMVSPENQNFCQPFLQSGQRRAETASDLPFPVHFLDQQNQMLLPPPPPIVQKQNFQAQHSMMNFSPNSTFSSSSMSLYQHHVEPPSNQRSYSNYPSFLPEENNIQISEGFKRQRLLHTAFDNLPPAPPFHHGQIPPFPPQTQRSEPSFSVGNHGVFNLGTRDELHSRNFEHHMRNANDGITFGFSSAISSPFASQELGKGRCECSKVHQIPEAEVSSSSQPKPFYFFLQSREEKGAIEAREKREDSIDLNLKL